jgi:hypothetical protein
VTDIELRYIADLILGIHAEAYTIEAGNVRHMHEVKVWKDTRLPEGKILMPGVISHATDLDWYSAAVRFLPKPTPQSTCLQCPARMAWTCFASYRGLWRLIPR